MTMSKTLRLNQLVSDLVDMLFTYRAYIVLAESVASQTWPDYHRGNHAGRIAVAKDVVNELSFTLNDHSDKKQDHENL